MYKYFVFWVFTVSPSHISPLVSLLCTPYLLYRLILPPDHLQIEVYIDIVPQNKVLSIL